MSEGDRKGRGGGGGDCGGENKHIFEMPVVCQRSGQAKCMLRCEIISDGRMHAQTADTNTTVSGSLLKLWSPPVDGGQKPVMGSRASVSLGSCEFSESCQENLTILKLFDISDMCNC